MTTIQNAIALGISVQFAEAQRQFQVLGREVRALHQQFQAINGPVVQYNSHMQALGRSAQAAQAQIAQLHRTMNTPANFNPGSRQGHHGLGVDRATVQSDIMAYTKGAAGITAAFAAVKKAINLDAELEAARAKFKVFMGSAAEADKTLKELRKLSAESPVSFTGSQQAVSTMLQFGVASKDVLPSLKAIAEITAGDEDRMRRLALAYAQASAAGKLMGQDLLQMVNAGFNPLQVIAKQTGKDMATLRDEMRKGQISFAMVKQAFVDAVGPGGQFNGLLKEIANTSAGQLTQAKSRLQEFGTAFGQAINPITVGVLREFNSITRDLTSNLQDLASVGKVAQDTLSGMGSGAISDGARLGIGSTAYSTAMSGVDVAKAAWQAMTDQREELVATLGRLEQRTGVTTRMLSTESQTRLKEAQAILADIDAVIAKAKAGNEELTELEQEYLARYKAKNDKAKLTSDAQFQIDRAAFDKMANEAKSAIDRQRAYVEFIEKSGRGRLGKSELSLDEFDKLKAEVDAFDAQQQKLAQAQDRIADAFDKPLAKLREEIATLRHGKDAAQEMAQMIESLDPGDQQAALDAMAKATKGDDLLGMIGRSVKDKEGFEQAAKAYREFIQLQRELNSLKAQDDKATDERKEAAKELTDLQERAAKALAGPRAEFVKAMAGLEVMKSRGMVDGPTYQAERDRLADSVLANDRGLKLAPSLTVGSQEAYKALASAAAAARDRETTGQERLATIGQEQVRIAAEVKRLTERLVKVAEDETSI